jgi:hypothetical protein
MAQKIMLQRIVNFDHEKELVKKHLESQGERIKAGFSREEIKPFFRVMRM